MLKLAVIKGPLLQEECMLQGRTKEQRTLRRNAEEGPTNFILMAYTSSGSSSSSSLDSEVNDKYKTCEGYHAVPPPYTGNFMPPKPDLVLADEEEYVLSESITSMPAVATSKVKTCESKPKSVSQPLIEDWISDSEDENETEESVEKVENNKRAKHPRKNSQSPRGNQRIWNNLMTQKLGSKTLQKQQYQLILPDNYYSAYLRPTVNSAKTASNIFNRAHSHVRMPFNKSTTNKNINLNKKVNIVRRNVTTVGPKAVVNDNKGNKANAVKASACWGNPQLEFQVLECLTSEVLIEGRLKNLGKPKNLEISQSIGPISLVADETVIKEWEDRMERATHYAIYIEASMIVMSHEVPSTQISSPFTKTATVILDSSTIASITAPLTISMISHLPQLMTPTPAPTTALTTISIPALPDFSSLFGFDQRVSTLETKLSQLKQADLSAQLLESVKSQLPTMVDDLFSTRIGYATRTALCRTLKNLKRKLKKRGSYTQMLLRNQ
ncbi:hypothetical protein Tco_0260126 [Tanacetum coccineum]